MTNHLINLKTQGNEISVLTIINNLFFFFHGILTGGNEIGAIDYFIFSGVVKESRLFIVLLLFPLLMAILSVKPPFTMTIIAIVSLLVLVIIAGHSSC